jgi:hypothetical protein
MFRYRSTEEPKFIKKLNIGEKNPIIADEIHSENRGRQTEGLSLESFPSRSARK